MNDQQFQDFVYQMTSAISSLGASQAQSSQQLSQQLSDISNQLNQSIGPQAAASAAGVFVDTFNRSFNFNAMKPQERPDQISQNQVFISGFSPAAASVLNRSGGMSAGTSRNELESIISRLPIVGPVWDTMKSIVSFFMSPANLGTLGGMGVAFLALKKFFNDSPAGEFFKNSMSDIYKLITDTLGKVVNFFTEDEFTGEDLRSKISDLKDNFISWVGNIFKSGGWLDTYVFTPLKSAFKDTSITILKTIGLLDDDGSFKYKDLFADISEIVKGLPKSAIGINTLLDPEKGLPATIPQLIAKASAKMDEFDIKGMIEKANNILTTVETKVNEFDTGKIINILQEKTKELDLKTISNEFIEFIKSSNQKLNDFDVKSLSGMVSEMGSLLKKLNTGLPDDFGARINTIITKTTDLIDNTSLELPKTFSNLNMSIDYLTKVFGKMGIFLADVRRNLKPSALPPGFKFNVDGMMPSNAYHVEPPALLDDAVKFDNNDNFIAAKEGGILTQRLDKMNENIRELIDVTSKANNNGGTVINQTKNTLGGRKTPKFANFDDAPGMDQMSFA